MHTPEMMNVVILVVLTVTVIVLIILYFRLDYHTYNGVAKGKYHLGLGALFKNESHILKEWIEHHKYEGFDHIYLVNDHSTDNYMEILKPYIKAKYITLYHVPDKHRDSSAQLWAFNKVFYKKCIRRCTWFMHLDLDEFLTSRDDVRVVEKVDALFSEYDFIRIPWLLFGSSGVEKIPESAVDAFTHRMKLEYNPNLYLNDNIQVKTLYRSSKIKWYLGNPMVHSPYTEGKYTLSNLERPDSGLFLGFGYTNSQEEDVDKHHLVINHYRLQSREFWEKVKCTRGDSNNFAYMQARDFAKFDELDKEYSGVIDTNLRDKRRRRMQRTFSPTKSKITCEQLTSA
jgi:hypothetical protein